MWSVLVVYILINKFLSLKCISIQSRLVFVTHTVISACFESSQHILMNAHFDFRANDFNVISAVLVKYAKKIVKPTTVLLITIVSTVIPVIADEGHWNAESISTFKLM